MAQIITVRDKTPEIDTTTWMADDAVIIGDVKIAKSCSVWFKAVIRGDVCAIRIGEETNVQDGVIIHGTYQKTDTTIGSRVSIGHGAILHGCTIANEVLIGMRATILDNAVIEPNVLVAAGAVVLENSHLQSGYIYAGVPAKPVKKLNIETTQFHILRTAKAYGQYSSWYK